jgi:hypothetical protein
VCEEERSTRRGEVTTNIRQTCKENRENIQMAVWTEEKKRWRENKEEECVV